MVSLLSLVITLFICDAFAVPFGDFAAFPEIQLPVLSSGGIEGGYNFNYQVPTLSIPVQQPSLPNYPVVNYQPPVLTSSWQESQKSGSSGYQGPITTIGSRDQAYPHVGANISPSVYGSTPNYAYDQRSYGYPSTGYVQSNTSPYQPNYGYDQRNYGYSNPSYEPNYGYGSTNYGYPSRTQFNSQPGPNTPIAMPNQGNRGYQGLNQPHPSTMPNRAYGPSGQVYPGDHHVQSNQVYDQRNYGYSSSIIHDTHDHPHPLPGEIY